MQNKINYHNILMNIIKESEKKNIIPKLLLHSCCAPCSSYVIEFLSQYFEITVFYYNPNIYPDDEYSKRVIEQKDFINKFPSVNRISFVEGDFEKEAFYQTVKGHENDNEGGERCFLCYNLRLEKTAEYAKKHGFDYFTTTLSISPYKNAQKLNEIGGILQEKYDVKYLFSDFKKNNGYKRSIEISNEYKMYRQDYCGCAFSKLERERNSKESKTL